MNEAYKRRILYILIAFSCLPAALLVPFPALVSNTSLAMYGSAIAGYIGIIMLLWMFVLGTKSVMGLVFRDLAPVLSAHKWLGKYGSVLFLVHPLLIMVGYGESLLYLVIPDISTQFEREVTLGRITLLVILLTWVISALVRDKLSFRTWKYTHMLVYVTIPFALLHVPLIGTQYMGSTAVKAYFFGLVLVFAAFVLLRLRGWLNLDTRRFEVVSNAAQNDRDSIIQLRPTGAWLAPPRPGQYVYLKLGLLSENHPFSVLHYDDETGELTLGYREYGMFTRLLRQWPEASPVYVSGPYGSFLSDVDHPSQPTVYIAGGIGVTPFLDVILGREPAEQWLFYAATSRGYMILLPFLQKRLGDHVVPIISDENEARTPEASARLFAAHLGELGQYRYYLCGPPAMVAYYEQILAAAGVSPSQISHEKFGW